MFFWALSEKLVPTFFVVSNALQVHPCPIEESCSYPNRSVLLSEWRKTNVRDAAAIIKLLEQEVRLPCAVTRYISGFSSNLKACSDRERRAKVQDPPSNSM